MHQSFLIYRRARYLKLSLGLMILSLAAYIADARLEQPNGGTWLGYTLGTIGALLIFWLLWFGVRKRKYRSGSGMVSGWLSGHVYLGIALLLVATLHCAFQFGWNLHTLAYTLMVLVILSGFYGVFAYIYFPSRLMDNGGGLSDEAMLTEIAELDGECLAVADKIGDKAHQTMLRSIESTVIGGGLWQQLTATSPRRVQMEAAESKLIDLRNELEEEHTRVMRTLTSLRVQAQIQQQAQQPANPEGSDRTTLFMVDQLAATGSGDKVLAVRQLLDLLSRKKALTARLQRAVQYQALLRFWLIVHVPLSIALLAALLAHIVAVFIYW
ncbi:MAG: hypothetical protein H6970_07510 [Gammaproteobacteria bacterium]|nr:hypothetical protein [Gammaproteobacteria bacterium]MCP5424901.1 hypothetical protein [Gammaproteobacteria bacterium]MCP5458123.1 hypothetical protein [Gammaproteobacteria bacterium]